MSLLTRNLIPDIINSPTNDLQVLCSNGRDRHAGTRVRIQGAGPPVANPAGGPKAASAPTNASFYWSALVSTDVVSVGTDVSAVVRFRIPVKSVGATLNTPDIAGLFCSNRVATSRGAGYSFAKWNRQVAVT